MEWERVLQTGDSSLLVHPFFVSKCTGLPCHNLGSVWKVWYGAGLCLFFVGETAKEREVYTHRVRETSVCLERWACLTLCVGMRETERERVVFPQGRLSLGTASSEKLSFLFPDKKANWVSISVPTTYRGKTAGECYTWVSQHRFRSVSPCTNIQIAIISCHLQAIWFSILSY